MKISISKAFLAGLAALSVLSSRGGDIDLNALIRAKVAAGEKSLTIPAGTIHVGKTIELLGIKEFTLEGAPEGSSLVFETNGHAGFNIRDCEEVTLKGFKVDYHPLPFTQGTVLSVGGNELKVKLHEGYPKPPRPNNLAMHVFEASTHLWKAGVPDFFGVQMNAADSDGVYLVKSPNPFEGHIVPGDLLAFDWRGNEGIMVRTTKRLTMEDVTIYSSPSLGIGGRFITGQHNFRRVKILRGPTPEGATEPRLLSTSADGLNYAACVKGPIVEDCEFSFMGDDGINFHGVIVPVIEEESPTSLLVIRPYQGERLPEIIAPGMKARFLKAGNFEPCGLVEIESFARTENKFPPDTAGKFYPLYHGNSKVASDVYRITLKTPVSDMKGCFLDIPEINNPGFSIRNCRFHDHRARGVRLMASGGIVENCTFERISQNAITVGPEYGFWREAGWTSDIVIRNNKINDVARGFMMTLPSCYAPGAIASFVRPEQSSAGIKAGNRNLTIEGNTIENCQLPGIFLNAVDTATVSGNTLRKVCLGPLDKAASAWGLHPAKPIDSANSINLNINDNKFE